MTGEPPSGDDLRAEIERLEAHNAELEGHLERLRFERDGYYGEWQNLKHRLKRFQRSPAWLVWLGWVFLWRIVLWPVRKIGQLVGAVISGIPSILAAPYLVIDTYYQRIANRQASSATAIPVTEPPPGSDGPLAAIRRRPRVLIVMPYSIYPPHHGGAVRLFNLIELLAGSCRLHLLIFSREGEDSVQRTALEPFCERIDFHHWIPSIERDRLGLKPPSALLFASDQVHAKIVDIVKGFNIEVVQLEYTELGQYISAVPGDVPVILTEHDVAFRSFGRKRDLGFQRRFPEGTAFGSSRADALRLERYEVRCVRKADQVHMMSEDDGLFVAKYLEDGVKRLRVLPNGVDAKYYAPPTESEPRRDVLYVGNFQNLPNVDALEYFVADVWPLIRLRIPDAKLSVVGANPSDRVTGLDGADGITIVGEVPDLRPFYHQHRLMVAPIRAGSGTRLKILEAFAAGLPVVSTTLGAEGIQYQGESHLLIADTAVEFAEAAHRVLTDNELADDLAAAAIRLVKERYDWPHVASPLVTCYENLITAVDPLPREDTDDVIEVLEPMTGPQEISTPDVSVLIPTLNGGKDLARCLAAVRSQQTDLDVEIVCVDSGSHAEDLAVMERHQARIVRIHESDFNHGLTRDLAALHAKADLLVFLDQGAVPTDDHWLQRIIEALVEGRDDIAAVQGGVRESSDSKTGFFWGSCDETSFFNRASTRWLERYKGLGFSTVNCAIRRSTWDRHRFGWAPTMEDKKWQREIVGMGYEIVNRPDATVFHGNTFDLGSLIHRCRAEGLGWRSVGMPYSLWDATRDMLDPAMYVTLLRGIGRGHARTAAEILFPWVRPINLWWGNRHTDAERFSALELCTSQKQRTTTIGERP